MTENARPQARTIETGRIAAGRKEFVFDLKENDRGVFLRITEYCGKERHDIVIPEEGFTDFLAKLTRILPAL